MQVVVLAGVYFVTAKFGLGMDAVSGFATLVWPPTGISLAALMLFGGRLWPGIAIGAFSINFHTGAPFFSACGIAAGNTLEAVLGVYLLRRFADFRPALDRVKDALGLIVLAALISTLVSATLGVGSLWLGGLVAGPAVRSTWQAWWLGDILGNLVMAPVLLTLSGWRGLRYKPRRCVEAAVAMGMMAIVSLALFGDVVARIPKNYALPYLIFPFSIWIALRMGPAASAASTFLAASIAIWGTAGGHGPFRVDTLAASLALLQIYVAVVAVTALILAAAVSERVRTERLSREYAKDLEFANRDLGMMLDVIAHDLREPLRSIDTFSMRLTDRYEKDLGEKGRDYLSRVVKASGRMRQLLEDILLLSRVKRKEMVKEKVPGREIVQDAMDRLESRIRERRARIRVHASLPVLEVDRTTAVEAVYNLLSNALKFVRDGQSPEIEIAGYRGPEGAGFSVQDRGPGVAPEISERIFQLFERGVGRSVEGTGAGLAIVRQAAERHGGRAWVQPRSGGGSEFLITFGGRRDE